MKEFVEFLTEKKEDGTDKLITFGIYVGIGAITALLLLYTIVAPWSLAGILGACIVFHCLGRFIIFLISCLLNCRK